MKYLRNKKHVVAKKTEVKNETEGTRETGEAGEAGQARETDQAGETRETREAGETEESLLKDPKTLVEVSPDPFTVMGLRRVHDGVTWLFEAMYFTIEGTKIVGVRNETATTREIAEAKLARDLVGLQFNKGPGMGKIFDSYFR